MSIIKASPSDLVEVLYLLKVSIQEMNCNNGFHWNLQNCLVQNDIENNLVFLYKQNALCIGMITLSTEDPLEYKSVKWMANSPKPLVAHRLIVHPYWKNRDVAKELLAFAEQHAQEYSFTSVRSDVFTDDREVVTLYHQLNYLHTGEFILLYQKTPYYCFEKIL